MICNDLWLVTDKYKEINSKGNVSNKLYVFKIPIKKIFVFSFFLYGVE